MSKILAEVQQLRAEHEAESPGEDDDASDDDDSEEGNPGKPPASS